MLHHRQPPFKCMAEVDMAGQQKQKPLKCMFYGVVSAEFMSI